MREMGSKTWRGRKWRDHANFRRGAAAAAAAGDGGGDGVISAAAPLIRVTEPNHTIGKTRRFYSIKRKS